MIGKQTKCNLCGKIFGAFYDAVINGKPKVSGVTAIKHTNGNKYCQMCIVDVRKKEKIKNAK